MNLIQEQNLKNLLILDKNVELLKNDKIFPKLVLDRKYEMEDFDAIEYVVAKKIKWLYENRYLKLE